MSGRRERRADSGVVAVLSVFFVLLLLTILAVAINLGRLMRSRGDLQHSADSAALAGVGSLELKAFGGPSPGRSPADFDGSATSSQGQAQALGQGYLIGSGVNQNPTVSTGTDIEYGFWHLRSGDFCIFGPGNCAEGWEAAPPVATLAANGIQMFAVNAVRVKSHYTLATYFDGVLNRGDANMMVQATAYGRRTRVPCALASAVSICQLLDAAGPGTGFTCPGGKITRTFRNNETQHPDAFGRIDLNGQWPTAELFMRIFTRSRDFWRCERDGMDMPPTSEYSAGNGMMPGLLDNLPRANIQPVVDAVAGVETEDGGHQPGRCLLGKTLVVPVIVPSDPAEGTVQTVADCQPVAAGGRICPVGPPPPAMAAPAGCIPWPSVGVQRVIGFVNLKFTAVHCWHETADATRPWSQPLLTELNCDSGVDTDPAHTAEGAGSLATNCSGFNNMPWDDQKNLAIDAEITCDAPLGPLTDTTQTFRPRLVQ